MREEGGGMDSLMHQNLGVWHVRLEEEGVDQELCVQVLYCVYRSGCLCFGKSRKMCVLVIESWLLLMMHIPPSGKPQYFAPSSDQG